MTKRALLSEPEVKSERLVTGVLLFDLWYIVTISSVAVVVVIGGLGPPCAGQAVWPCAAEREGERRAEIVRDAAG